MARDREDHVSQALLEPGTYRSHVCVGPEIERDAQPLLELLPVFTQLEQQTIRIWRRAPSEQPLVQSNAQGVVYADPPICEHAVQRLSCGISTGVVFSRTHDRSRV